MRMIRLERVSSAFFIETMPKPDLQRYLVSFLLLFLFGGAIVGETVSLSMAVTVAGSSVLGKLFLVNGVLLFLLPPLFFNRIDKVNRGRLLSVQLLIVAIVLICYMIVFTVLGNNNLKALSFCILMIYPLSYLSKTTLFLSFWTLANDIYTTDEAKKEFPRIAAWGFIGGLSGACGARLLLEVFDIQMILGLWAIAYLIAYFFAKKITKKHKSQFLHKEYIEQETTRIPLLQSAKAVLGIKLIRLIAILYFFVFIAVFMQDFLFWKKSALFFPTANSLAAFQFSYYVAYSFVTIAGLRFVMPSVIARWGFTRVFSFLPVTLLLGSLCVLCVDLAGVATGTVFMCFLGYQFFRYVVFENAFSPVYQMFFAAIPKEKRGRAKTFLEGIVKPSAIMLTGLALIAMPSIPANGILAFITGISALMILTVVRIRKTYTEALVPNYSQYTLPADVIAHIGGYHDQKILALISEYSQSHDSDIRTIAVKILAYEGSRESFTVFKNIFEKESDSAVREMLARYCKYFAGFEIMPLLEIMVADQNPRIRANALHCLNSIDTPWKNKFYDTVKSLFFEAHLRVQIESAIYLWHSGQIHERENVQAFLKYLLQVKNTNKRSAGLFLVGEIRPGGWEDILLDHLHESSMQVFTKCVETIMANATEQTKQRTLTVIATLSRKHISVMGRILSQLGAGAYATIINAMAQDQDKRMMVELVLAARQIIETHSEQIKELEFEGEQRSALSSWIINELATIYKDAYIWTKFSLQGDCSHACRNAVCYLEQALVDQHAKICDWALDVVALLDKQGVMATVRRDLDMREPSQRNDMIELLEAFAPPDIGSLIIPILRSNSLAHLAKVGNGYFNFDDKNLPITIDHFVSSQSHWICICALYCVWQKENGYGLVLENKSILQRIYNEKSSPVVPIAAALLHLVSENKEMSMEPFDLLEQVMSLKKTQLFRNVPAEKLIDLAGISKRLSYKKGTLISREGELSDHLYIVAKGSLKIVKIKSNVKTILTIIEKGDTYGEIGLFNQAPRSASAIADSDCDLWVIQRSALKKLLLEMPDIAYNLLEVFSEKLKKSGDEVAELKTGFSGNKKELTIDEV